MSKLQPIRKSRAPARNAKCPCGSGLKAKKCCLAKIKLFNSMSPDERKRFYTERLFLANRVKEQIAKQQAKQNAAAETTKEHSLNLGEATVSINGQEIGTVTDISLSTKEPSND